MFYGSLPLETAERALIGEFLDRFSTLVLATRGANGPWATALFFARDDRLNLYFISSPESRHARELASSSAVSVAVNADHARWENIQGLQIAGEAGVVGARRRPRAVDLYLRKFGNIRELLRDPVTDAEKTIAAAFRASEFYCVRPRKIRWIDNTQGFGHAREYVLE